MRRTAPFAAGLIALCLLAAAAVPSDALAASLFDTATGRIDGRGPGEVGRSVDGAGDFDGDGLADVVVGAPEARPPRGGAAFVVFGRKPFGGVDTGRLGARGVHILGAETSDGYAGTTVAGAGDVNGDGLDDVVVTDRRGGNVVRPLGPRSGVSVDGSAYVIYGRRSPGTVDLRRLGGGGFAVIGIEEGPAAGAGDVNGDGLADVVIGAGDVEDGGAYVVFGARRSRSFDAAKLGQRGFRIVPRPGDLHAPTVARAGDVNGDGLDDVVIGAPVSLGRPEKPSDYEPMGPGVAHVVFGQRNTDPVHLSRLRGRGFRVNPPPFFGFTGAAVAGAGDVNGDGLADVLVGAPSPGFGGARVAAGSAFVVFGEREASDVTLGPALGGRGFEIRGARTAAATGSALAGVGDVSGDGLADVLIGAPGADSEDPSFEAEGGTVYVVHGRRATGLVRLSRLGPGDGFPLKGLSADSAGTSVAMAGDVNGDTLPELVVGAPLTCPTTRSSGGYDAEERAGAVYLVTPAALNPAGAVSTRRSSGTPGRDLLNGSPGADRLGGGRASDCLYGGAGDDRLSGGPGLDGLVGGSGGDVLRGGGGDDLLGDGSGADTLIGGSGRDQLTSGAGHDRLRGGSGTDELEAGSGPDRLAGGAGTDQLDGGTGNDSLGGGRGIDELLGGGGRDRLVGGISRDILAGGRSADLLDGGPGDDQLQGDQGRDRTVGGAGDDVLVGGSGRDRVLAGSGNDLVHTRDRQRDIVSCGPGRDRVWVNRFDVLRDCEVRLRRRPRAFEQI